MIYFAGESLVITCNGYNACNGLKVYCGTFDPPGSSYSISDMDDGNINCLIQNVGGASNNIYFHCKGHNVAGCTFTMSQPGITTSTLECDVESTAICMYSCALDTYCAASNNLLCHSGSPCSCYSNKCGDIVTTTATTSSPTFNPTTSIPTTSSPITVQPSYNPCN